ncbi:MAG: hypothetical protein WKF45_06065 [Ilumatobacteraceae bacterium]|jgi:hypothetical protein
MTLQVSTNDASALTDSDLDEMASLDGSFDIGTLSKAKEDWVLVTTARDGNRLAGYSFSTLERIGGTPCVLLGLLSVRRTSRRDTVLRGLMSEAYHRALMAFPDEDVVVGSRFVSAAGVEAFKDLTEVTPSPGVRAVGEERAWGRRLAKRFSVDKTYDDASFVVASGSQDGFVDTEPLKPEKVDADVSKLFANVRPDDGGAMIVYGWVMAEQLVKLGARS